MTTHSALAKSICVAACTTGLAGGVTLAPAAAEDQRPCVTQREYRAVEDSYSDDDQTIAGWRQKRVAEHFDTAGRIIFYSESHSDGEPSMYGTVWKYRKCSTWGPGGWYVGIYYSNYWDRYMRVVDKVPNRPWQLV